MKKYKLRNIAKAARNKRQVDSKGCVLVHIENPNSIGTKLRKLKPFFHKSGQVSVKCFNGIYLLEGAVVPHLESGGTGRPLRNAEGKCYKAHVHFYAKHVVWIDEAGVSMTPNQRDHYVNMFAYRNRPQPSAA